MDQDLLNLVLASGDIYVSVNNDQIEQISGEGILTQLLPFRKGESIYSVLPPVVRNLYKQHVVSGTASQGQFDFHLPVKEQEHYFRLFYQRRSKKTSLLLRAVANPDTYAQELQRIETRFRIVLESAAQGILMVNIHGQIVLANNKIEKMFGYSSDELMYAPVEQLIAPAYRDLHIRHRGNYVSQLRSQRMAVNQDISGRRKDGSDFPIDVYLTSVEMYDGLNIIAFISDISEQKKLQNKIRRMEKLEAIGQLAGGIAHDFNNVLAGIIGLSELAQRKIPKDSAAMGNLTMVIEKAQGAAQLVRQLLAFSRQQVLSPTALNLNTVIKNNQKLLQRYLGEDIHLTLHLEPKLFSIRADASALDQIITNLCINARDAMPDGGDLTIFTENVDITSENISLGEVTPQIDYVKWTIRDTGVGMRGEVQKHIFEPFYSTKEFGHGTGLGLATVYGLVEQHNGVIQFDSVPGEGTQFFIYFPALQQKPEAEPPVKQSGHDLGGTETILIIDDEKDIVFAAAETLRAKGYTVYTAGNGIEGLAVFETAQNDIDLVISDVVMPKMGGIEVKILIRKLNPKVKFLHISAYSDKMESEQKYLQKPFLAEELLSKIRKVLDGRDD